MFVTLETNFGLGCCQLVENLFIVILYMIFLIPYEVIICYFGKNFFPIMRKQGLKNCLSLCFHVFTITSRLKSEQKEKEK